jgi:hypothetical protein
MWISLMKKVRLELSPPLAGCGLKRGTEAFFAAGSRVFWSFNRDMSIGLTFLAASECGSYKAGGFNGSAWSLQVLTSVILPFLFPLRL